ICTCNTRLQVLLDGDTGAWRRRLLMVEYSRPKPQTPVRDFADKLLDAEASGILFWMLQGPIHHLEELHRVADYVLTDRQHECIGNLLSESDRVRLFVQDRVTKTEAGDVTTEELLGGYFDYCDQKGWSAKDRSSVCKLLPDLMLQIHRVSRRHDIDRNNKS